jgi:hypothetical protein
LFERGDKVTIKVYNLLGKEIITLVTRLNRLDTNPLLGMGLIILGIRSPSGIYICQMKAGNFTKSQKMVLMK